ncbi:uncharacterized protein LOC122261021 [Penaeus japonicus]|uniref:uncharacterized protein LOC122261021 n=1 Tax=Penaeus japonicus TaxID=27405 RepID=UPI001C7170F8|nr:uncharacterized protein LOC122261021 [Penaeus japonicus]
MIRRNVKLLRMLVFTGGCVCILLWTKGLTRETPSFQVKSEDAPDDAQLPSISQDTFAEVKPVNGSSEAEVFVDVTEPESSCQHTILESLDQFYDFIHRVDIKCMNLMQIAGRTDEKLLEGRRVCVDFEYLRKDHCLVYLFGVDGDWTFAEEINRKLGCKVYVFDPAIEQDSANHSSSITSYKMSVSSHLGVSGDPPKKDQLLRIMEMLGHEEAVIDLLWVDMPEGEELYLLDDLFSSSHQVIGNIKQIGLDIHPMNEGMTERIRKYWHYFQLLNCHGLRMVTRQPNIEYENLFKLNNKTRSKKYELLWAREM